MISKKALCFSYFSERTAQCFFHFLSRIIRMRFSACMHIRRRKCRVVSKGGRRSPFGSGSSNRARVAGGDLCAQHRSADRAGRRDRAAACWHGVPQGNSVPLGTRFCLQSLVCYTFCDRWRGKGAAGRGQDVSCDSRTERFCNAVIIAKLFCRGPRKIGDFVGKGGTAE